MENPPNITPRKILFISLYTGMGGGEHCLYQLMKNLDRSAYEPILMVNASGKLPEMSRAAGIRMVEMPFATVMLKHLVAPVKFWKNFKAAFAIRGFIREEKIELVHCADLLPLLLLVPAALTGKVRCVYNAIFFHEPERAFLLNLFAFTFVKRIVADSFLVQEDLGKKTVGLVKKMSIIHHAVDRDEFHQHSRDEKRAIRASLNLPADKKIIGFVGRYDTWKGHLTFLDAADALLRLRSDLLFLIVGGAPTADVNPAVAEYRERVQARAAEISPKESIIIWDHRDDVAEIMASLDLFICPSDREPFGLVVLEAYASGLPVVVSMAAGALEALHGADEVYMAQPKNAGSFVWQIQKALEVTAKRDKIDSIFLERRASFVSTLNWKRYAEQFGTVYASLPPQ